MNSQELMGLRIRERRLALGYTLEELGKMAGVQSSAVSKWEKGAVENIPRTRIKRLAQALECDPVWLMGIDYKIPEREEMVASSGPKYKMTQLERSQVKELTELFCELPAEKKEIVLDLLRSMTKTN